MQPFPALAISSLLCFILNSAFAFNFNYTAPTQCDNLEITWSGGQPPFSLLLTPAFSNPTDFSIPDTNFVNGQGSFSFQLALNTSSQFLLTMSDGRGIGTGGTSAMLVVGASKSGAPCNVSEKQVEFTFELNTALQQCRPYEIENYTGAKQPVTIIGLIPLGTTFVLRPPVGPTSFESIANIPAGTDVIFLLRDAQNRSGGSSDIRSVGRTGENSCINAQSPSSTASATPSQTAGLNSTSNNTAQPATATPAPGSPNDKAALIGGSVAGVAALFLLIGLLVLLLRGRRRRTSSISSSVNSDKFFPRRGSSRRYSVDLIPERGAAGRLSGTPARGITYNQIRPTVPFPSNDIHYEVDPFVVPQLTGSSHSDHATAYTLASHGLSSGSLHGRSQSFDTKTPSSGISSRADGFRSRSPERPSEDQTVLPTIPPVGHPVSSRAAASNAGEPSKPSMAQSGWPERRQTRLVLHTDADDVGEDTEEPVVELPPQYTDRRPDLRANMSSSSSHLRPPLPSHQLSYDRPPPTPSPPSPSAER